jgi:hypothetical protein
MAISFPSSLDNFTNPTDTDPMSNPSHPLQHSDLNDAVEALEAKLGVGASPAGSATTNQVLTASTGGTTTWSSTLYDLASQGIPLIRPITGLYYRSPVQYNIASAPVVNRTNYLPIFFPTTTTIDRIGCLTASTFSGTASVRLGIYNDTNGRPGTLLLDAGTVAPTAASTGYQITISQVLSPGVWWVAFNTITAATTNTFYGTSASATANTPTLTGIGTTALTTAASAVHGFEQNVNVTSGYANTGTITNHIQAGGMIYLRAA